MTKLSKWQKGLSLHPLEFEEVLADALQVKPPPEKKKRRGKKKSAGEELAK